MAFNFPVPLELDDPILGFRFAVTFLGHTGPGHVLDFRFQSVKGLSLGVEIGKNEAGYGDQGISYPQSRKKGLLELERGLPLVSTLRMEFQESFRTFQFKPRNVLVSLLTEDAVPASSWIFHYAYPVEWSMSDWDATNSQVVIERLKLTYSNVEIISL